MICPHCKQPLTAVHVRKLWAQFMSSLRRRKSGGKVWRNHRPGYSRCKCKGCNRARAGRKVRGR